MPKVSQPFSVSVTWKTSNQQHQQLSQQRNSMPTTSTEPISSSIHLDEQRLPPVLPKELLRLPNELLLHILHCLDESELYTVALSCKQLHFLALPVYFSRRRGSHPLSSLQLRTKKLFISWAWDFRADLSTHPDGRSSHSHSSSILRGVHICLFITSLKSIRCQFSYPEKRLLRQIRTLHRVLEKLTHVEEVELDLRNVELLWKPGDKPADEWVSAFLTILEMISERSCTTLTIHKGGLCASQLQSIFNLSPMKTSWFRSAATGMLRRRTIRSSSTNVHAQVQDYDQAPLLKRAVEVLNFSKLSRLSLLDMDIYPRDWKIILPRITLPHLTHLTVSTRRASFGALTGFLSRHPLIQELQIIGSPADPMNDLSLLQDCPHLSLDALPRLSTLVAPEFYVVHLLSPLNVFKLPSLKRLKIFTNNSYSFDHLQSNFASLDQRLSKLYLSLRLHIDSHWAFSLITDVDSMKERGIPACLRHIASIEIKAAQISSWPQSMMASLPLWLSLFPQLREVVIEGPIIISALAEEGIDLPRSVFTACTGVQSVVIDGKRIGREAGHPPRPTSP